MKTKRIIGILTYVLILIGIIMILWVNMKMRNYVIPNTGLMVKEVMKDARQTVSTQMWIGIIAFVSGYFLTFFQYKK